MGKMEKVLWFLFGTFFGWLVIWFAMTFGAAALTALGSIFVVAFPVFAVIGIIAVIWWLFFR